MKIVFIYPPPWKIPLEGKAPDPTDGPPPLASLDWDFHQLPYGLFSLAAQCMRAGHQVKLLNLSCFPWEYVWQIVRDLDAHLFAMSCWTSNRRGVALVAQEVKKHHPASHVLIGGPHATALPEEMLQHHEAIDSVAIGESEQTVAELIERLEQGQSVARLAGLVTRQNGQIVRGPERGNIANLDTLANPILYFHTHILMTARGCPWACTFCGAENTWGRGFRGNSIPYVLDGLSSLLPRLPVKMIQIKDDTFTVNRKRVLEFCRGIRERNLHFVWSCDTRVDVLDDELLREMRLAGCERLSLGVESGSDRILKNIDKKITAEDIVRTAETAKKYGVRVRFYMMIGNRGETRETFEETLRFLERAKPHQYLFTCLSIYPGTRDFDEAVAQGKITSEAYFTHQFQELVTTFDASPSDTHHMMSWFAKNKGVHDTYVPSVADYRAILERLPSHAPAMIDLGAALFREGALDEAESLIHQALKSHYALPGLAHNYLACIAYKRGDLDEMQSQLASAAQGDSQHQIVLDNVIAAYQWLQTDGPRQHRPLNLVASHDFHLLERAIQPTFPGALPKDFATWAPATLPTPQALTPVKVEDVLRHNQQRKTSLPILHKGR